MPPSAPAHTLSPRQQACRLVRNPWTIVAIILLYAAFALVSRDSSDDTTGFMLLRGKGSPSDGGRGRGAGGFVREEEELPEREVVEQWDPVPDNPYGYRGPVKGGVEVYPLQPSRRPRKSKTPLVPEVAEIEGVSTAWKMPGQYARGGGEAIKGLYVVFHGCSHSHLDWFDLPEERAIVSHLVEIGYAVVAPASRDRQTGCWRLQNEGGDLQAVKTMLWRWYRDWSIPPNTPLFLFGASSGGGMATALASKGGFQLCDKRTTYVRVSGVMSQVSWGIPPAGYGASCPPVAFMPMPKGDEAEYMDNRNPNVPQVFGNSRKIPTQITSIAHYVRRSGGKPRMLLLPLGELSLYREFFSDRVYEISVTQSEKLYGALVAAQVMRCNPDKLVGGEVECFLNQNPRIDPLALDTLVATYEDTLRARGEEVGSARGTALRFGSNGSGEAVDGGGRRRLLAGREEGTRGLPPSPPMPQSLTTVNQHEQRREQQQKEQQQRILSSDEDRPDMTKEHATEVFRELLNVAWGAHEISADFVVLWEKWLWESCGDDCRPGPWR